MFVHVIVQVMVANEFVGAMIQLAGNEARATALKAFFKILFIEP